MTMTMTMTRLRASLRRLQVEGRREQLAVNTRKPSTG
jgi:hypothetical protein